uniref:Uncharacterized protein n=1 Tax=Arundo donax TaxID=35708 RepID=A0A0A9GPB6_ARUDO
MYLRYIYNSVSFMMMSKSLNCSYKAMCCHILCKQCSVQLNKYQQI